jgi:hypothetical protein
MTEAPSIILLLTVSVVAFLGKAAVFTVIGWFWIRSLKQN